MHVPRAQARTPSDGSKHNDTLTRTLSYTHTMHTQMRAYALVGGALQAHCARMPTKYGDRQVATSDCFCVRRLRIACVRRQRSGWTNAKLCSLIVARLGAILKEHASEYQPVLFLDALPAHLATPVMDACSRTGILPLVIPAGCTDILQPLDTHIFSSLKARLRELYSEALHRCEAPQKHRHHQACTDRNDSPPS